MQKTIPKNFKIFIETYGCSANLSDSEIIAGLLTQKKFGIVDSPQKADVCIINTCIVKSPTEQRMIHRIRELSKLGKLLVVAGCMTKTFQQAIKKINPAASMIGPDSIERIVDIVQAALEGKKFIFTKDLRKPKICMPRVRKNPVVSIIEISTGCLGDCAYCGVKYAKGKLLSYPVEMIVKEAKQAIADGCRELWLTSQDNSCYGMDTGSSLPQLLDSIKKIDGEFFARVGMMNPSHAKIILEELVKTYESEKIFKFLHLPVQSGSDKILKSMNRNYSVKDFVLIVEKFRKSFPQLTLSTDVIVGFPGEQEQDFEKTLDLISKVKPDIVNISKFGARPRTEAARMEQLDANVVNQRSAKTMKVVNEISRKNNERWIGWRGSCLVDERIKNGFVARNFAYRPIVIKTDKSILGKIVDVEITAATTNCLLAK
jgi:threonylcarbamoyladenosine tRNA methylthiotransferase CDKAL1